MSFRVASFLFIVGLLLSVSSHGAEPIAILERHAGLVEILDSESRPVASTSGRPLALRSAHPLYAGQTIQTGADGRALLVFKEGRQGLSNKIIVAAKSRLVLERAATAAELAQGRKGTSLRLQAGEIRSAVEARYKLDGDDYYRVRTGNALAGVRGTRFFIAYDPKANRSDIAVTEGEVEFSTKTGSEKVPAGHWGFVQGDMKPSKPVPIPDEFAFVRPDVYDIEKSWGGGDSAAPAAPPPAVIPQRKPQPSSGGSLK